MSGVELVSTGSERFVILKRLSEPGIGDRHACTVPVPLHLAYDDRHWYAEFDGTDRDAWLVACKSFGIDPPTT